jgi:maleylacetoacetate isomerase/maleylpyruvate isomerase
MRLYTYFRSSAAYRVRIVLSLKGLEWRPVPIHMLRNGGEHRGSSYRAINPQGLIPALDDGGIITQSIAICEYLEEKHLSQPCCRRTSAIAPMSARS